ncbi:glycosyltransferase family 4 protein, partial [bacterium]|nr:glycosyltransferase family 4 protein [bacterium]
NVLLQAMQSELPIVATDVEGVSELIQDRITGRVVKPRDAKGLWKSMEELLQDEVTQQEYSKNAKTLVMKEFTWEKIVNEYDLLYSLLINEVGSLQRA